MPIQQIRNWRDSCRDNGCECCQKSKGGLRYLDDTPPALNGVTFIATLRLPRDFVIAGDAWLPALLRPTREAWKLAGSHCFTAYNTFLFFVLCSHLGWHPFHCKETRYQEKHAK